MPKTLPIPPSAGPPPHSPADSNTFVIESTVARTLESSTFAFSQVECTGAASERASRATQKAASATANEPAKREREQSRRSGARRRRGVSRAIRAGPMRGEAADERLRDEEREQRRPGSEDAEPDDLVEAGEAGDADVERGSAPPRAGRSPRPRRRGRSRSRRSGAGSAAADQAAALAGRAGHRGERRERPRVAPNGSWSPA